ncbi:tetratricopeptide repeat protein [Thiomonas sp. FB-Cd]|uniref:tetratricopeptide repeat protein n=1 Tax=Thiomonas sp. FB-Cd TaxID=1158292 RepID=UPI0009DDE546|nr:tetratricopeptide repeat protein [Thiomonas sp. FB-Cd]
METADEQFRLGASYIKGEDGQKDFQRAAYWFQKAADSGHTPSQFNLAMLYEYGLGVNRDLTAASAWYEKAAQLGHEKAKERLNQIKQFNDFSKLPDTNRQAEIVRSESSFASPPYNAPSVANRTRETRKFLSSFEPPLNNELERTISDDKIRGWLLFIVILLFLSLPFALFSVGGVQSRIDVIQSSLPQQTLNYLDPEFLQHLNWLFLRAAFGGILACIAAIILIYGKTRKAIKYTIIIIWFNFAVGVIFIAVEPTLVFGSYDNYVKLFNVAADDILMSLFISFITIGAVTAYLIRSNRVKKRYKTQQP